MRRYLSLILVLCLAVFAQAENVVYQEVNYTVDPDLLTAEVVVTPQASGELYIPEEITVGQETYRVTSIGDKAFKGCKNLTAIVLPKTLERVYRSAFDGTGIMLDKTNWTDGALYIDSCLIATDKTIKAKFIIPEGTRLIAAGAFQGNKTLTRVEFPTTVRRIDHETFRDCKNLTRAIIPQTITEIGEDAFTNSGIWNNEKKWKKGGLYIDGCLIAVNNNVPAKFVFKNKIPTRLIAAGAFANSKKIKSVVIPATVSAIPNAAFYKCENLTDVTIPASVKHVGNFAFYGCKLLREATLPTAVETLGMGAFYGCENLRKQVLSDKLTIIPQGCFYLCRSIQRLTLPAGLRKIDNGAFTGCSSLEDLKFPANIQ